jgi:hypothetical protein
MNTQWDWATNLFGTRTGTKGICTPRGLTEHLIGSLDIVSGPVQPGDKHPHATFA